MAFKKTNSLTDVSLNIDTRNWLAAFLDRIIQGDVRTIELARLLPDINTKKLNLFLEEMGWLINRRGYWIVTEDALVNGFLYNKNSNHIPFITEKGGVILIKLYINGDLPSKKSY